MLGIVHQYCLLSWLSWLMSSGHFHVLTRLHQPCWSHRDNQAGDVASHMTVLSCCAAAGVRGRSISLKLKRRKTNAPDPPKFMGHGDCDNMSRSVTLSRFTDAASELGSQGKALLRALRVDPTQIRGIGLNVSTIYIETNLDALLAGVS